MDNNQLIISYTPEMVDEAIKQHMERNTGYTGEAKITYTAKRKTKQASAEIILSEAVRITSNNADEVVSIDVLGNDDVSEDTKETMQQIDKALEEETQESQEEEQEDETESEEESAEEADDNEEDMESLFN